MEQRVFSSSGLERLEQLQRREGILSIRFDMFRDPADAQALEEVQIQIQACEEALRVSAESFIPLDY